LEQSLNAATARVAYATGLDSILETARALGIESPLPKVPSVVLGAAEVTPLEVSRVFATFASGGVRPELLAVRRVLDRSGVPLERRQIEVESVLPADTAFLITHMLSGVLDRGTARAARAMGFDLPAAGKTGTTNDYRDAWFVGFTPTLLVTVWVGFDDNRPIHLAGAQAALPIWVEFMREATRGHPPLTFQPPPDVELVTIDPQSGELATPHCPETLIEAFYRGLAPTRPCPLHNEPTTPDA
jgi:membrane carboxypeptidase/penicillin-binding protein